MYPDISIILAFEPISILKGREKEWSQYKNLGQCYLPQVVLDELQFLTQRAVLPEEEKTAREFSRFFPHSHWQIHQGMSSHKALQSLEDENLSKNARLYNAIAQSVYDLTINNPDKLVVFISNKANLRQDLDKLKLNNFTCLTLAQFNQWLRTKQKPIIITQIIQQLTSNSDSPNITTSPNPSINKIKKNNAISNVSKRTLKSSHPTNPIPKIISGLLTIGALTILALLSWYLIEPKSFQEFRKNVQQEFNSQ